MELEHQITESQKTRAFIGKKADVYFRKWGLTDEHADLSAEPVKRISWNWAAALFSGAWLGYRKMYKEAIIYLLILMTVSSLLGVANEFTILDIGVFVILGFLGNRLYFHKVKREVNKVEPDDNALEKLSAAGGTTWLCALGIAVLGGFMGMIFGAIFNW
ncbi:DUF2628 domain-containing protein [Mesobacillus jeotgali]|uniref:DUF2628 domain-containing protein n=1 Tax=Mesobacillus jeotgali TaxID=129985 RepID=UPI00178770C1|nr:DUF2628 domain-containing protein [Mesobacillus jeotgali]UYZ21749.1 DUF2628 domain-containing protein [Mesobacillus jeotgali]